MAESEILKKLKDVPYRIQSASIKERRRVVQEISEIISTPEVNEQIVRFICRVVQTTLLRYRDSSSQSLVRDLLIKLCIGQKEWTVKNLPPVLLEISEQLKNTGTSKNTSISGLYALRWSTILVEYGLKGLKNNDIDYTSVVLAQANLLAAISAFGSDRNNSKAYNMLHQAWKALGEEKTIMWLDVLLGQPAESGPHVVVMFSALCKHFQQLGKEELCIRHNSKMLDAFIKSLISVKFRPNSNYIKGSKGLLAMLSKEDVKNSLLPSMQKAMLRNPEIIIVAVGIVLETLSVDLDSDVLEVGKSLIGNLPSKEEAVRCEAAAALSAVARQLRDVTTALEMLRHVFNVYNGANGKLTQAEHKMAVLLGAGNLSETSIEGEGRATLVGEAVRQFGKVLEAESHERTLCCCLDALGRWLAAPLAPAHADTLLDMFKKNLSLKSTSQLVRTAYIQLLGRVVAGAAPSAPQRHDLQPTLVKSVEKAIHQPLQQAVVGEGISAAYVLVQLDVSGDLSARHAAVWTALTHAERHVLLQERVLAAATDDVLIHVALLCKTTLEKYNSVYSLKNSPVHKALVMATLSPSKHVRSVAIDNVKSLIGAVDRCQVARALALRLTDMLEEGRLFANKEKGADDKSDVTGKMVADCITAICSYTEYPAEDMQNLAVDILKCCHHPAVVAENRRLWPNVVRHMRLQPAALVALYINNLKNAFISGYAPTETMSNVVATLARVAPALVLPGLVEEALHTLADPDLLKVTRDEYFTYLTPEGELYDKTVVPGNDENSEMNLKRESKAYSYKEQLEELQLRRELEDKRRREGKLKEVPLTAKQKEAIKLQTAKENAIRQRLTALNAHVEAAVGLIEAGVCRGGPGGAGAAHARRVVAAVLHALRSPLSAPHAARVTLRLRALLPRHHCTLAAAVAYTTLRLHKPQCDLDPNWEQEDINRATSRVISQLHSLTVARKPAQPLDIDHADRTASKDCYLTCPAFCFVFPLLKMGLTSFYAQNDEAMVICGLQVIAHHATLRGEEAAGRVDLYHPSLLPIDQMFKLLIDLISSSTGRVQTQCTSALLESAQCASGAAGCARASLDEVHCLLAGLQSPVEVVRDAALRALLCLKAVLPELFAEPAQALELTKRFWIAKFDVSDENKQLAEEVWAAVSEASAASGAGPSGAELGRAVLREALHPSEPVQRAAAAALAALLQPAPDPHADGDGSTNGSNGALTPDQAVPLLLDIYNDKLELIPAKLDQFGHVTCEAVDEWGARRGVALCLRALAPRLPARAVPDAVRFLVQRGLADRAELVRDEMFNAAMALVELHGKETLSIQLPVFEQFLDSAPKSSGYDAVRQCVVLLVGSLARHLAPDDERIKPITMRLVAALSTPSQQVQEAVSNCLPHLVTSPALKDDIPAIVNKLMKQLLTADKYGDRKGAAYGIAGIVKGLGILALKQLDIMTKLTDAIQEKKNYRYREGALFAFEMLCQKLGRLFEPYIIHVLPHLLTCFGDSSQYVRAATDDTAKLIMSKLSAHGVKLVLPSLLHALHDDSWRTKTGSVELLGAMAYCAPKQLSSCLPSIVPKLIEVLGDSHMRVQAAGAEALKVIGSVIRNPEIQAIVPVLLQALQEPSDKTSACLQTLLDTKFVHFIDAPSLALIMPVVQRAFMDRSTETRKMAAQIIGNMYSLTDQKDLTPYLPSIIPGLKASLLDPVPEVRSVSARALGAMVRGMGEASFEELLPWLMQTLTSESSSVDRSGAAQGLSEVVAGLGVHKLHTLMPDIIATAERTDIAPHVKDGYIMMFIYMPGAFTNEFLPYIGQIINPILKALADENEYVRETALKAGQRIVNLYAESAITLLLPELENGLFDDNWRIRYSSVQLLGDLLYKISGVSGKMSTETASEDDNFGTEQSHSAIMTVLGAERRNRVLAGLYMGRSDVALMVRQAALHVWKVVVTNTPRTLREILPTLFGLLLGCLASTSYDKRQVAARTLGDLVRKLGERVLPEIVPILEQGLQSDRPDQRQGVCIGLGEIVASTSRDTVLTFVDGLVPTVRKALCDPLPEVRMAAAKTFDSLHATVGSKALDDILPYMLEGLHDPDPAVAEATLDGLKQIMAIKSRAVLPYLIPQLTATPANTRALAALATAAGDALVKHLHRILPALLLALESAHGTPNQAKELEYCRGALLPVTEESGVRSIIDFLLEASRAPEETKKRAASFLLCAFVSHTRADQTPYIPQLIRGLFVMFAEKERDVLQMAWEALHTLTKNMEPERQIAHVADVRQAVRYAAADLNGELLPGFCLPKGIAPVLPLFRESVLNGGPEEKETAAMMLTEVMKLTSPTAIQSSVIHITGPLIRILGDRFSATVKAAVLETLALLLAKCGQMLKQFLPQLQTTFLRALHDPNRPVRMKAGWAISQLVLIHNRADPLFIDIHNGIKNTDDPGIKETMIQALRSIISLGADKMTDSIVLSLLATLTHHSLLANPEDPPRSTVGGCLGAIIHCLPMTHLDAALHHHIMNPDPSDWYLLHGRSCALFVALKETPEMIYLEQYEDKINKTLMMYLTSDKVPIASNGIRGLAYLFEYMLHEKMPIPQNMLSGFARSMNHQSNDVKQVMCRACTYLGRRARPERLSGELLRALAPALVNGTKEKNTCVKAGAELALYTLLHLGDGDTDTDTDTDTGTGTVLQLCLSVLEEGARDSLSEAVGKVQRRPPAHDAKDDELDCTLLT